MSSVPNATFPTFPAGSESSATSFIQDTLPWVLGMVGGITLSNHCLGKVKEFLRDKLAVGLSAFFYEGNFLDNIVRHLNRETLVQLALLTAGVVAGEKIAHLTSQLTHPYVSLLVIGLSCAMTKKPGGFLGHSVVTLSNLNEVLNQVERNPQAQKSLLEALPWVSQIVEDFSTLIGNGKEGSMLILGSVGSTNPFIRSVMTFLSAWGCTHFAGSFFKDLTPQVEKPSMRSMALKALGCYTLGQVTLKLSHHLSYAELGITGIALTLLKPHLPRLF